jgi:ribosomal protein S6--L-glutamate ligase
MSLKDEFESLKKIHEKKEHDPEAEKTSTEEVKGLSILLLTSSMDSNRNPSKKNPTIKKFEAYCEKHKISYYTAYADSAYLEDKDGKISIHNVSDEKGFRINRDKTFVIARRGVVFHGYSRNLIDRLEHYKFCFLNEMKVFETCEDKYLTYLRLVENNVPVPRSILVSSDKMIEYAHKKVGGKFPVIIKTPSGTQGKGVVIASDMKGLKSTVQALWSVGDAEMMLQEFIKSDHDVRIHVLGDEVIASMKRNVVKGDFRSNVHLGGETATYEPTDEVKKLAVRAAKSVGGKWVGVDIMFDQKGNPYVLEVNASAGTDGIEALTKKDIVAEVMKYVQDGVNWTRPPQEVGVLETISIENIGELAARFDTGNAAESISMDAQDIKVRGKDVTWTTNGKRLTAKMVKEVRIKANHTSDEKLEKRPVVKLNVTFEGVTYKNVLFNLNDRSHKSTPVLINKSFMIQSGSVINPSKVYAVTEKPEEETKIKKDSEEREEN